MLGSDLRTELSVANARLVSRLAGIVTSYRERVAALGAKIRAELDAMTPEEYARTCAEGARLLEEGARLLAEKPPSERLIASEFFEFCVEPPLGATSREREAQAAEERHQWNEKLTRELRAISEETRQWMIARGYKPKRRRRR
jgi:hypothetical protein